MIDTDRLDINDFDSREFAAAIDDFEGELQAAANWIDDAFGEIEAEVSRLAPTRLAAALCALALQAPTQLASVFGRTPVEGA